VTITDSAGMNWAAPMLYAAPASGSLPSQINYEVTSGAALGPATVSIAGTGGISQNASVLLAPVSPGLFELNASGLAAAYVLRVSNGGAQPPAPDFQVVGNQLEPLAISLGPSTDLVSLELLGTGISAAGAAGTAVTINGTPATVTSVGPSDSFPGLDEVVVVIPRSLSGAGSVPIALTADAQAANTVYVTIQ